jgi:formamidopyrimidine-DNA glycosylase
MPELPEVETTRRGLAPAVEHHRITRAVVRHRGMRLPVPRGLEQRLAGATVTAVRRRGKYLLFDCTPVDGKAGALIVHLGMSGRLWLVDANTPPEKHDHFDLVFDNSRVIRLRDPRRFGLVLWQTGDPLSHPLLAAIGPEPLTPEQESDLPPEFQKNPRPRPPSRRGARFPSGSATESWLRSRGQEPEEPKSGLSR